MKHLIGRVSLPIAARARPVRHHADALALHKALVGVRAAVCPADLAGDGGAAGGAELGGAGVAAGSGLAEADPRGAAAGALPLAVAGLRHALAPMPFWLARWRARPNREAFVSHPV